MDRQTDPKKQTGNPHPPWLKKQKPALVIMRLDIKSPSDEHDAVNCHDQPRYPLHEPRPHTGIAPGEELNHHNLIATAIVASTPKTNTALLVKRAFMSVVA